MKLFEIVPDNFFSLLSASKRELYVEALLVLHSAFKSELLIKKSDLLAMLVGSLETSILDADFEEEEKENLDEINNINELKGLSGKSRLLLKKIQNCGWVKIEFEGNSFEEIVTIPDYAIPVLNLLSELTREKIQEYNSYVYTTFAALKNAEDNEDFAFEALSSADKNTIDLIDSLKLLFNNIQRFHKKIADNMDVNTLLEEYFDRYKQQIMDQILYPLKTMDSVPRFKNRILEILYSWQNNDKMLDLIVNQGMRRRVFSSSDEGHEIVLEMINRITETYESVEGMLDRIDERHRNYTTASVDRIRYMLNSDRSIKGKLVDILQYSQKEDIMLAMQKAVVVYEHRFMDIQSLYSKAKRTIKTEGEPLAIVSRDRTDDSKVINSFLNNVKSQFNNKKIDDYLEKLLGDAHEIATENVVINDTDDFILFMLATLRAREVTSPVTIEFLEGKVLCQGYGLPKVIFRRKQ